MTSSAGAWSTEQLHHLDAALELEIAVRRAGDGRQRWTPVWVVRVGQDVFVRSWYRRETGWFAGAVSTGRARVRAPGLEVDVAVVDLGDPSAHQDTAEQRGQLFDDVDAAYRSKYGARADETVGGMVAAGARATTLRLDPLWCEPVSGDER